MRTSLIRRASYGLAASAIAFIGFAGVAAADCQPLAITALNCDSGFRQFDCLDDIAGGSPPYRATWRPISGVKITSQDSSEAYGTCGTGYVSIGLTVTDSAGNTVTGSRGFYCYSTAGQ